ncbi:hypothetical protein MMC22_005333, partial [Lobaria immixta]|nr:hypothetical protein [Lobaria immixta]
TKLKSSQSSPKRTTVTENPFDKLYEDGDNDFYSTSDVEYLPELDCGFRPQSLSQTLSSKPDYSRPQAVSRTSSQPEYMQPLTYAIHEYFTSFIDSITGLECCKRNHCSKLYAYGSGTTTSKIHLKKEHKIDITDRNELKQATYNDNIITALSHQPALEEGRKTRQLTEHLAQSMNKKSLEYLYLPSAAMARELEEIPAELEEGEA